MKILRFITSLAAKPRRFIKEKGHVIRLLFMLRQRHPHLNSLEGMLYESISASTIRSTNFALFLIRPLFIQWPVGATVFCLLQKINTANGFVIP